LQKQIRIKELPVPVLGKNQNQRNPPPVSVLWGKKKMKKSKEPPVLVSLKTFPRNSSFG